MNHEPIIIPAYTSIKIETFNHEKQAPHYMYQNNIYAPYEIFTRDRIDIFSDKDLSCSIENAINSQQDRGVYIRTFTGDFYAKNSKHILKEISEDDIVFVPE